jgi:hypothetical protein
MHMFRAQPIINSHNAIPSLHANLGTDVIVAVETTQYEAAAMEVDDGSGRISGYVNANRDAVGGPVLRFYLIGSGLAKVLTHRVINPALIVYG